MSSSTKQTVSRRRVFYVPGYDPIHPRRYRELHRSEGAKQAALSGYSIGLKRKADPGSFGWHVGTTIDGQLTETDFDVLVWSDIVRASMDGSIPQTYWQLLRTAWIYVSTGTLGRLMKLRKGPVIAALYPIVALLLQAFAAIAGAPNSESLSNRPRKRRSVCRRPTAHSRLLPADHRRRSPV